MVYCHPEINPRQSHAVRRIAFVGLFALMLPYLAACSVGREFDRPPPGSLQNNETTKQGALSRYGDPYQTGTLISNDHQIENITYAYAVKDDAHVKGVTPVRQLNLYFLDNILVGHSFVSSFREGHTDFDETIVPRIQEGEDTCQDVTHMFGRPGGEYVFPMMKELGTRGLLYSYSHTKVGFTRADMYMKTMLVTCNEDGVVKEVEYSSSGQK